MGSPYKTNSRQYGLFEAALGIRDPWVIEEVRFDYGRRRLDIILGFQREYVGAILHPGAAKFYTCGGKI